VKPFDETKYYLGSLCKRGHDYDGTGQSLRYMSCVSCRPCVECVKVYGELYKKENREKNREYHKKLYKENPEKYKKKNRKYRKENPDKCRELDRKYRKENLDKYVEYNIKYRKENPEKNRESSRKETLELSKNYIENRICLTLKIEREKITPEMIELKREQLMFFREIQQYKKEIKDGIITG